ncbi:TPA: hypothetical protein ACPYWN_001273 [Klebsiella oxytoca]
MNIETVNELIQSLESAGELSIKERKYLELAKAYADKEAESVAQALTFEKCRELSGCPAGVDLQDWVKQLAAENAELKEDRDTLARYWIEDGGDEDCAMSYCEPTPATDRIVAGIKADGRVEGINFAASRLAAAFNHGFVDKSMAEVYDVVRMILTAKEDLANNPAEDGMSGEYAEKSLAEWRFELREGADK